MFENSEDPANCPVKLLKMYLERRPAGVDFFYLTPISDPKSAVWYKTGRVGISSLSKYMKEICILANITPRSNHILRATTATRLYEQGVDEQLIKAQTGHRSDSVQAYKRTSVKQQFEVSNMLHTRPEKKQKVQDGTADKENAETNQVKPVSLKDVVPISLPSSSDQGVVTSNCGSVIYSNCAVHINSNAQPKE
jgi:hypothetical protein